MKTMMLLAALLAVGMLSACSEGDATTQPTPIDRLPESTMEAAALAGDWTHSYEEEAGASDEQWFRPSQSREFAESWFRMRYHFEADGTCEWMWLAPNDAHEMRPGTWDFDDKDPRFVRVYDDEGRFLEHVSFRVLGLDGSLMRVTTID